MSTQTFSLILGFPLQAWEVRWVDSVKWPLTVAGFFFVFAPVGCGSSATIKYAGDRPINIPDDSTGEIVARRSEYRFAFAGLNNGSQVIRLWGEVQLDGEAVPVLLPAVTMS